MELRSLGGTGLMVSPVGLGTVKFGRNRGVKYPAPFDLPDDATLADLLAVAADLGINLLDTAPAYGSAEERLGRLLAGQRDRWLLATKVGEEFDGNVSRFDFSPSAVRRSVERSLRRLRTDRLDIVSVHSDGGEESLARFADTLEALRNLQRGGALRAVGFSGKSLAGGMMAAAYCDVVMLTYNPAHRAEQPAIAAAQRAGKAVLVKKALASGHLPGLGGGGALEAALRFVLAEPGVSSVVLGSLDPAHLAANVAAATAALRRPPPAPAFRTGS